MPLNKYVFTWGSFVGQPGYSVFYTLSTFNNTTPFNTFWDGLKGYLPLGVTVATPSSGEVIDEITGKMTGVWSQAGLPTITGTGASTYAPSQGVLCTWLTGTFRNGRNVKGHTYIVPAATGVLAAGGIIAPSAVTAIKTATDGLRGGIGSSFVVFNRPVYKKASTPGDPPVRVRDGSYSPITGSLVPSKPATLKARRDT